MKKVLFLSNHFITLYNFRKELISRLIEEGHEVYISMPINEKNCYFSDLGCKIIETEVDRRGINPIQDIKLLFRYISIMISLEPDIIFSYTIKPNIYGSIASNITRFKQVNNITGTGGTFLNNGLMNLIARLLYKISVKHSYKVYFQNEGDKDFFVKNKMVIDNYELLPGSGVNLEQYEFSELPNGENVNFIFIGRVMKLKGIDEYLKCASVVKNKYKNVNFYLAGFIEEKKYEQIIDDYVNNGIIQYIGFQDDIKSWIQKCHCIVLPSHGGEGVPNVLLESSAMGRICIASNISGSKDIVEDNVTGFIFERGKWLDLLEKIELVINLNFKTKQNMAVLGRKKVEQTFDRKYVISKYINELHN